MEIPLDAQVECTDGICGRSKYILIDPVTDQVTNLVVKQDASPNAEYMVPVNLIAETIAGTIRLRCNKAELEKMAPFVQTQYVMEKTFDYAGYQGGMGGMMGSHFYMPYITSDTKIQTRIDHLQIPPGELAVRRGARVEALDGYVGKVDEFVVNPENGHIAYLVMREGHLWGQKDVLIPLSALGDAHEDSVFLKINKSDIEALPAFPVHRRWS